MTFSKFQGNVQSHGIKVNVGDIITTKTGIAGRVIATLGNTLRVEDAFQHEVVNVVREDIININGMAVSVINSNQR